MAVFHSIIHCETSLSSYTELDDFTVEHRNQMTSAFEQSDLESHTLSRRHQSGFSRLMESTTMLQKVLCLVKKPLNDIGTLPAIEHLDFELRDSLDKALTVTVDAGVRNVGAVSILIRSVLISRTGMIISTDWSLDERLRALFLLHEASPIRLIASNEEYRAKRSATLDCISRMMVEAALANFQGRDPIRLDRHPLTGVYNVRAAIRHLTQKMHSHGFEESEMTALRDLHAMDNLYASYWGTLSASL